MERGFANGVAVTDSNSAGELRAAGCSEARCQSRCTVGRGYAESARQCSRASLKPSVHAARPGDALIGRLPCVCSASIADVKHQVGNRIYSPDCPVCTLFKPRRRVMGAVFSCCGCAAPLQLLAGTATGPTHITDVKFTGVPRLS